MKSKIGAGIALAFLALIALAFASGDISGSGAFGGVAGGDRVASIGDGKIDTSTLSQAATSELERIKEQNPRMSMKALLAGTGLDRILDGLIDRTALGEFGKAHGLIASDRLIDSEITQMPGFKGPDGNFSQDAFRQVIAQQGISEALVREDLAQGLIARQVLVPAAFGASMPASIAQRYAGLLRDRRTGAIAVLPATAFVPAKEPTEAELAAWYGANTEKFIRPERRVIRYASFGADSLKLAASPTEAEIAARYTQNKAQYAALETRSLTQVIVPTEAAAKAVTAEVAGGTSLETAASAKGLAAAKLAPLDKAALSGQSTKAVADAVFAAGKGAVAAPAKSALGWHVVRVDAITARPARSLDQARAELVAALSAEMRRTALSDMLTGIEDGFDDGGNLTEAAKKLGLTLQLTLAITADGQVYEKPGQMAPPALAKVIETAFAMEREGEPQIAEVEAGKTFVIFDVTGIESSAAAPLKDIRADVKGMYLLDEGNAAAKLAAGQVLAAMRKGATLQAALAALKRPVPPPQPVTMGREDLARMQQQGGQVPPPLALLFSMAKGTAKMLAAPGQRGWFVVSLSQIAEGSAAANDPMVAATRRELAASTGREYAEALRRAIRTEVGVERNAAAIKAVRNQLTGNGN